MVLDLDDKRVYNRPLSELVTLFTLTIGTARYPLEVLALLNDFPNHVSQVHELILPSTIRATRAAQTWSISAQN